MPRGRRQYNPVRASDDDNVDENESHEEQEVIAEEQVPFAVASNTTITEPTASVSVEDSIQITILDVMQKRFLVDIAASSNVRNLKLQGALIHKVPADRQRLIFHGRLLQDEESLQDAGLNQNDLIIHLFPKPRVVIKSSNTGGSLDGETATSNDAHTHEPSTEGARVPTIFLDEQEAQQRSTILVLGSQDYMEAQNNVKLFSFMLLMISTIELLSLLSIVMGVPQESNTYGGYYDRNHGSGCDSADDLWPCNPSDDIPDTNNSTTNGESEIGVIYQQWGIPHYFDLVLSLAGIYVAMIGLKAANHNTLRLARRYLYGTFVVGVYWLLFNYFLTYAEEKRMVDKMEEQQKDQDGFNREDLPDNREMLSQALSVMVLPFMIWGICCLRAWQFHHLLHEAEEEAEVRIRAQAGDDEELGVQSASAEMA